MVAPHVVAGRPLSMEPGHVTNLGCCWACDDVNELHAHHIIPRSSGGEYGPQVVVCSTCHGGLHKLADANLDAEKVAELFQEYSPVALTRATHLATIVVAAREAVKDDVNKSAVFQDRFPATTRKQLRDLTKLFKRNQQQVVRHAIAALHKRYFG